MILIEELERFSAELVDLIKTIKKNKTTRLARSSLKKTVKDTAKKWFSCRSKIEGIATIDRNVLLEYDNIFDKLIALTQSNNLTKSYIDNINSITKRFDRDMLIPIIRGQQRPGLLQDLKGIILSINDDDERKYLEEAATCADNGCYRATVVMGWAAAIDRIHKKIGQLGIDKFNKTCLQMKQATSGPYKRFNKLYELTTGNDLREVFDGDLLLIIRSMGLIDVNQQKHLQNCFDLRTSCAHPGDYKVELHNLLSFYTDLSKEIFSNPNFSLT